MRAVDEQEFLALSRGMFGGTRFPMTKDMNMTELVALIERSGKELARALLKSRLAEDPRTDPLEPVCRQCQGKLRIQEHAQRRALNTAIGEIEYRRAYGVCDQCGHTAAPLDEALGIPSFGPSVEVMRKIDPGSDSKVFWDGGGYSQRARRHRDERQASEGQRRGRRRAGGGGARA